MSKLTLFFILNSEVSIIKQTTLLSGDIKKALVSLALPLLAGTLLQQLYNTADVLIVGRFLGVTAFAAVGVAGSVMNLFLFALNGFCAGLAMPETVMPPQRGAPRICLFTGYALNRQ